MSDKSITGMVLALWLSLPAAAAAAPAHDWSARYGDTEDQTVSAVATGGDGRMLVCGQNWGTLDLGGGPLPSAGMADIFVAAFAPDGSHLWSRAVGGAGSDVPASLAVDADGNVLVAGTIDGSTSVDFGGGPLAATGVFDVFVAKYDAAGAHVWSRIFGDAAWQQATSVAVDADGNVAITGGFEGTIDFGGGALTSAGSTDVFVARFSPAGTHLLSARYGAALAQIGIAAGLDGAGNLYVGGQLRGTIDFGGGPLVSAGLDDVFLAKLSPAGAHVWSRRFGSADLQWISGLAVDDAGNVVITGNFNNTIDFGGGPLASTVTFVPDIYVARFAPDGAHAWSWRAGDADWQRTSSASFTAGGDVVIAGDFNGAIDLGGGAFTNVDEGSDIFVGAFDPAGAHVWSVQFPDTTGATAVAAAAPGGAVALAGHFLGTVDIGGGPLSNVGWFTNDMFVARLGGGSSSVPPPAAAHGVLGNQPNPFNPSTTITFALARRGEAVLEFTDARGALVARLDLGFREPGKHAVRWDGRDRQGRSLPSGVYLCRLAGQDAGEGRKLVLLR